MADSSPTIVDDRRTALPEGGEAIGRPRGRSLKPLALLWPYARRHWITVTVALVFLLAAAALSLAIPMLLGRAADAGQRAGADPALLKALTSRLNRRLQSRVGARPDERLAGVALVEAFSIDNGLLTQTLKQKRDRIADRDAQAIEAIYGR